MTPGMVSPSSPLARARGLYIEAAAMNARALPIAAQVLRAWLCVTSDNVVGRFVADGLG
jgi:hypothetical protein